MSGGIETTARPEILGRLLTRMSDNFLAAQPAGGDHHAACVIHERPS